MDDYIFVKEFDNVITSLKLDFDENDLNDYTDFIIDLNFDSLSIIQLIVAIENNFNIVFPDSYLVIDDLKSYKRLKEITKLLIEEK